MAGSIRTESRAPPLWSVISSHSADTVTVVVLLLVVAWSIGGTPRHDVAAALVATLVLGLLVAVVKRVFRHERPPGEWGEIYRRTDPYSFPSGHAARVGLLAVFAWWLGPTWLGAGLTAWALLVCLSRLRMGVHRRVDVLCGLGLGVAFGLLWAILDTTDRIGIRLLGQN